MQIKPAIPSTAVNAALRLLHQCGVSALFARLMRSRGVILMLHRVTDGCRVGSEFRPNAEICIDKAFLEAIIDHLLADDWSVVGLDEALTRLSEDRSERKFAVFTFDDGYLDNLEHALPVFRRHDLPFTVYATTGFATREHLPWWYAAEEAIAAVDEFDLDVPGLPGPRQCATLRQKRDLFARLRAVIMRLPPPALARISTELLAVAGRDPRNFADSLLLSPEQLSELAAHPGVEIGAHSHSHTVLAALNAKELDHEIAYSCRLLESWLGTKTRHFCYPFGGMRECGPREAARVGAHSLVTGTTTVKALLATRHADTPHALPRVAINGSQQQVELLQTQLSGLVPALNRSARALGLG